MTNINRNISIKMALLKAQGHEHTGNSYLKILSLNKYIG